MNRSFLVAALTAFGAVALSCSNPTSTSLNTHRVQALAGGKQVTIDVLVVRAGQIVTGTSAGQVQAFSLAGGVQTLLGSEPAITFQAMSVTVPSGASLVLKVLPFQMSTLVNWFQGPEASGPHLSSLNPYTVPFASLLSNYTADCSLAP